MYNPSYKVVEFDHFIMQDGLLTFVLSAKQWIERTNAIVYYQILILDEADKMKVLNREANNTLQVKDNHKED